MISVWGKFVMNCNLIVKIVYFPICEELGGMQSDSFLPPYVREVCKHCLSSTRKWFVLLEERRNIWWRLPAWLTISVASGAKCLMWLILSQTLQLLRCSICIKIQINLIPETVVKCFPFTTSWLTKRITFLMWMCKGMILELISIRMYLSKTLENISTSLTKTKTSLFSHVAAVIIFTNLPVSIRHLVWSIWCKRNNGNKLFLMLYILK